MPYQGHCMCHDIQVTLEEQPENTLRCHCRNCARPGGGSSLNYTVNEPDDTHSLLKDYEDNETTSGNCALVKNLFVVPPPTEPQLTYIFSSGNFVVIVEAPSLPGADSPGIL
ncbi:hypothetical protein SI65_09957 [Aspergillus cristatus]|uniref:CENP-V/GFA domain-containing protein n=1 Tax=Aspergillus cristatus TaxID=573508 RepID=A0A1E3B110_ASPCR|nr:hypothetical protein SI65_09957 [Aspergillus cristatus]